MINWDHTGITMYPSVRGLWIRKVKKRVKISGLNDKWQITMVLAVTKNGHCLPPQVIYAAVLSTCLPKVKFPTAYCMY